MQYLKADTITEVTIGPAVAVGDGFTTVTNLVGESADNFKIIKNNAITSTTIAGTLAAIPGADGYYALDLSATNTNTEGRLTLLINHASLILPIRHEFMVVNANVFDSLFAAAGTDLLDTQVRGMDANVLTATAINANAIGASELATDAIGSAQVATGAIDSTALAANAINAASIATAAMDGKGDWNIGKTGYTLSAAGVDAIFDELLAGHTTADSVGLVLNDLQEAGRLDVLIDAIKAKTDDLTFTKANEVDANAVSQNDVTIIGTGGVADKFRV